MGSLVKIVQMLGPYLTQALQSLEKVVVRKERPVFSNIFENQKQVSRVEAQEFEVKERKYGYPRLSGTQCSMLRR